MLHALVLLQELGQPPRSGVELVVNTDEEVGSPTSRQLIEQVAAQCSSVLVFEPGDLPGGAVNTSRKGVIDLDLVVHGRAAHAGADHAFGINAAVELARHTL